MDFGRVRLCLVLLIGVALCLPLSGCSSKRKPTKANFDKVNLEMTLKEVEKIMGDSTTTLEWGKEAEAIIRKLPEGKWVVIELGEELTAGKQLKLQVKQWEEGDNLYTVLFMNDTVLKLATLSKKELDAEKAARKPIDKSKLTKENIARIDAEMAKARSTTREGLSLQEIEAIIGPGNRYPEYHANAFIWGDEEHGIAVIFSQEGKANSISLLLGTLAIGTLAK